MTRPLQTADDLLPIFYFTDRNQPSGLWGSLWWMLAADDFHNNRPIQ